MEIHFGEGGRDSKNFVHELSSLDLKYASRIGFAYDILDEDDGVVNLYFKGSGVQEAFKGEGGKHVIQRVPITESQGRRQTSIVTVAVMPLLPDTKRLDPRDIAWSAQTSHGKGGQNQNKVASAVRMSHKPTGMTVFISGRDRGQNYQRALKILTNKVETFYRQQQHQAYNEVRTSQFTGAGRGEKLRTYNMIRHEVTDHRTGKTVPSWEIEKGKFELLH